MSVSNLQSSTGALVGNNSTTTGYVVPFAFQLPSDLVVVKRDASGNVTTLSLASGDYTVTQNANLSGGTVYTTTAWDATNTLVISRVVPLTQLLTPDPRGERAGRCHHVGLRQADLYHPADRPKRVP